MKDVCQGEVSKELDAMKLIAEALANMDKKTCARILDWAADIYTDSVLMPGCIRGREAAPKGTP